MRTFLVCLILATAAPGFADTLYKKDGAIVAGTYLGGSARQGHRRPALARTHGSPLRLCQCVLHNPIRIAHRTVCTGVTAQGYGPGPRQLTPEATCKHRQKGPCPRHQGGTR